MREVTGSLSGLRRPLARIAAFSVVPSVSLISNLIVLPILSARFGVAGWTSVLLGMSIGAATSMVCALSWGFEGANLVARVPPQQRVAMYQASVRQRMIALVVAAPVVVTLCLLARPMSPLVCVLMGLAVSLNALAPGWYFVGVGRPSGSMLAEGIPRLVVNLICVLLVAVLPLWTYPVALVLGMGGTLLIARVVVGRSSRLPETSRPVVPSREVDRLRPKAPLSLVTASQVADAGYYYLTGPLVAFVAPAAYAVYAAFDRLSTSVVNVLTPLTWGLVAWTNEVDGVRRERRVALAVGFAVTTAAAAFLLLFAMMPVIIGYVFAGTVHTYPTLSFLGAAGMTGTWLAFSLKPLLLIPLGLARSAYVITLIVACVALAAIGLCAVVWGSEGAIAAAAAVPLLAILVVLAIGRRGLDRFIGGRARLGEPSV